MLALRALARLVEVLLMAALALVGLGVAMYCASRLISLGSARPDRLAHLPAVRREVGHFLSRLATPGPVAALALLGGVAAVLVAIALCVGVVGTRRERTLVVEEDSGEGGLYAQPRAVSRLARGETERTAGVTGVRRPRVRLARSGHGGRLTVLAARGPEPDGAIVDEAVHARLDPIGEALHLRTEIRVRLVEPAGAAERRA